MHVIVLLYVVTSDIVFRRVLGNISKWYTRVPLFLVLCIIVLLQSYLDIER